MENAEFISEVTDLWLFPSHAAGTTGRAIESWRSRRAANARRWNANTFTNFVVQNAWRDITPMPVHFRTTKYTSWNNTRPAGNAPLSFWAVADLSNGHPYDREGRVWLFAFTTREAARKWSAAHRKESQSNTTLIDLSQPFRLWQAP